jgi:S-formylglutathione hydrolase FrmB
MEDVRFRSNALGHNVTYRVVLPATYPPNAKLPVVWLLHGAGDNHRSWTDKSGIAEVATHGVMLVMPDGENSYYVNSASRSNRRYQDYIIDEVIPDARRRFPVAATDREDNAIIGISRGGFGALVLALKHPQMFSFAGSLSGALDVPERRFRWRDPFTSLGIRRTFGPMNSPTRKQNDPFLLIANVQDEPQPTYFYLTCGEREVLLPPNRRFADILQQRRLYYTFETTSGGHNWNTWNRQLPGMETSLLEHFRIIKSSHPAPVHP